MKRFAKIVSFSEKRRRNFGQVQEIFSFEEVSFWATIRIFGTNIRNFLRKNIGFFFIERARLPHLPLLEQTSLNLVMFCQVEGTLSLICFRFMHLTATAASLVIDRETIRLVIRAMDPQRVSLRATHKLRRRKYI